MQNTSLEKTFIHRAHTFMTSMKCPIFAPPPPLVRIGQDPPPLHPWTPKLRLPTPPTRPPIPFGILAAYLLYLSIIFSGRFHPKMDSFPWV